MASDIEQTPFVKQLAANDRRTREKALTSLQNYLTSARSFTALELLKIWKGLFFCIFHTDRPLPQKHLSQRLSSLILALPPHTFLPFLQAFYTTLVTYYSQIPSLRLDKYLYLIRCYVSAAFKYLSLHSWSSSLITSYFNLMQGPVGPLSKGIGEESKVPDGLRYHVLDVWVEELRPVIKEEDDEVVGEKLMNPVRTLEKEARGKTVRKRAGETMREWERRQTEVENDAEAGSDMVKKDDGMENNEEEWEGFEG